MTLECGKYWSNTKSQNSSWDAGVGVTAGPTKLVMEGNWSWRVTVCKTLESAFMTPNVVENQSHFAL
jgi:hypothetical protein